MDFAFLATAVEIAAVAGLAVVADQTALVDFSAAVDFVIVATAVEFAAVAGLAVVVRLATAVGLFGLGRIGTFRVPKHCILFDE